MKAFFFGEKIFVATKLYEIFKNLFTKIYDQIFIQLLFLLPKDS
jgi:hypothetical protein